MERYLYLLLLTVTLSLIPNVSFSKDLGKGQIKGIVFDENLELLMGATVKIMSADSTMLNHAITDSKGEFKLLVARSNKAFIEVYLLGYETYFSELIPSDTTLLSVCLKHKSIVLDGAIVTAKAPLIRMKDGNLIVDATQIPNVDNLTLKGLLDRVPGVSTQSGLSLYGVNATLYIDGVKQDRSADALLNSLQGTIIQEVELLLLPTAEWGITSGSIINVKTKRGNWDGYYLAISSYNDLHKKGYLSSYNSLFIVYKKKQITFNSNISFNSGHANKGTADTTWYATGVVLDKMRDFKERLNAITFLGNLHWESEGGHSLNLNTYIYDDFGRSSTDRKIGKKTDANYITDRYRTKTKSNDDLWSGQIEYKSPDSLRTRASATYGIVYGGLRSKNNYFLEDIAILDYDRYMRSKLDMIGHRHTIKGVVQQDIGIKKKLTIYVGFNATLAKLTDKANYWMTPENPQDDYLSRFTGKESTLGLYTQMRYTFNENWSAIGYFKAEYTNYDLNLKSEDIHTKSIYWKYFPFLTLSFSTQNYKTTLGYATSMSRPDYEWMLPGVRYSDEFSYTVGNPDLAPMIRKRLVWTNLFWNYMTFSFQYIMDKNIIGGILTGQDGDMTVYSYMNYADIDRYNAYFSLPYQLFNSKLSGDISAGITYSKLKKSRNDFIAPKGRSTELAYSLSFHVNYEFSKRFTLYGYFGYQAPVKKIQSSITSMGPVVRLGASYSCLKDNMLTFTVQIDDLFKKTMRDHRNYFEDNFQYIHTRYDSNARYASFSIRFKLSRGANVANKAKEAQSDLERFGKS